MAGSSEFAPDLVFETQTWPGIDRSGANVPDAEVGSLVGAAAGASLPEEPRRRPPAGCVRAWPFGLDFDLDRASSSVG